MTPFNRKKAPAEHELRWKAICNDQLGLERAGKRYKHRMIGLCVVSMVQCGLYGQNMVSMVPA